MMKTSRRGLATTLAGGGLLTAFPFVAARAEESAPALLRLSFIDDAPPYPEAHASTIVEIAEAVQGAAWFGGTKERNPDVEIWFARCESGRWSSPVRVADGVQTDGTRYPTWNPVLFQPPGEELLLFYKVGPTPQDWWGMVISSADGGRRWSTPRRLPDGILGPIKNKPVVLADGAWLSPSSVEAGEGVGADAGAGWSLHFERSDDHGATWTKSEPVASPLNIDAIQPSVLVHRDGGLQAVARTRQGALGSTWSIDGGRIWSPLGAVDLPNPNSGTDAVTLADGRKLIVYNPTAHAPGTPGKGPRSPLALALSDDGVHWRRVLTLEIEPPGSPPLVSGFAYPAVIQTSDGLLHLTWTWDRKRIRHAIVDPSKLV